MSKVQKYISGSLKELVQYFGSTNFSKSVLTVIAVITPLFIGINTGYTEIGLAICFGAFWCNPSDVNGSQKHKVYGILFSAALVMVVSFIGGYLHYSNWLALVILGVLSFGISLIASYGFRASLISFSGLLALILSFAHTPGQLKIYEYSLLVGLGGLWYLALSLLWYKINPKGQTEEILYEIIGKTGDLLKKRGKLINGEANRKKLQKKIFLLQSQLTEQHDTLREILILSRINSGTSTYNGKRVLVLVQLIEMLETAGANPVNYTKMDEQFAIYPEFTQLFQHLIFNMAEQLQSMAKIGNKPNELPKHQRLNKQFKELRNKISELGTVKNNKAYEAFIMFQNLLEYQEKQFDKLKRMKWLLSDHDVASEEFIDKEILKRFLISQDYSPRILLRNLSFRSTIFRHSLRLAITLMVGFVLGNLFSFQNLYWILLTIILIMRPSYGLTKARTKDRTVGTIIGGVIATAIVYLVQDIYVYGILALISFVVALSMLQKNYKLSAIYVTLSIVFIYGILQPDIMTVIQYRILDTLVGAGLSYLGFLLLWPSWSFQEIQKDVTKSVQANQIYLSKIADFYINKGKVPTSYRLARKNAFLETSNLSSAFQRMTQEPHSKQKNLNKIYELVELNHNFLSSLASLSIYIQNHKTTEASERFNGIIHRIDENLSVVLDALSNDPNTVAKLNFDEVVSFEKQLPKFESENVILNNTDNSALKRNHQEEQLIWEQLRWLFSLSSNMMKLTTNL
ncbi:FUSC family membrane protein [Maribacter sp. SA7]|uniref:FUSC family protein n=1 Tax=Maribacter zhoushanensis TaxID=3030012 RepID=UPI0023EDC2E5|nr:FUSC family membrane protein [Maribacter zhoushanensis]MDF4202540.1 FUSC family membrane protein [Maribacter zhoushanensis]